MTKNGGIFWLIYLVTAVAAFGMIMLPACENPGRLKIGEIAYGNVHVVQSSTEPPADDPFDLFWQEIAATVVQLNNDGDYYTELPGRFSFARACSLKVVKSPSRLYLWVSWRDTTRSVTPNALTWTYDRFDDTTILDSFWDRYPTLIVTNSVDTIVDSVTSDTTFDTLYFSTRGGEDQFSIIWDVGNNGSEGANCFTMCHDIGDTTALGHRKYTTGGGNVDVWNWKAGTTDPIALAQDEYWSSLGREMDQHSDTLYSTNYDAVNREPFYMNAGGSGVTLPFLTDAAKAAFNQAAGWTEGKSVPGYVLKGAYQSQPDLGSISDVHAYSVYSTRGTWYVLLTRALNTGNPDDINFSAIAPGDSVMATAAVMFTNNILHKGTAPFYIIFP